MVKVTVLPETEVAVSVEEEQAAVVQVETPVVCTGTSNYNLLDNKPRINGHIIIGNKTGADYELVDETSCLTNLEIEALLNAII